MSRHRARYQTSRRNAFRLSLSGRNGEVNVRSDACPSDEMLLAFNLGELPEAVLESIREHQDSCFPCELRARQLDDQTDLVIDTLRRAMTQATGTVGAESSSNVKNGTDLVPWFEGPCRVPSDRDEGSDDSSQPSMAGRPGDSHDSPPTDRAEPKPPVLPDYEVGESLLGRGSTGVVYKARHLKLNRIVALKMIAGTSSQVSAIFEIEAKAVARLQHPNIVQIFDIGTHEGQPFLALEFVEGGSLDQKIAGRPQPPHFAAEMVRTLALAADHAHRQGIVHCDLKPLNILITPEGVPKIADFGVAKWLESEDQWGQDGEILGTPRYMAPEQASGSVRCVGPTTDVYSLGVILYEMLIGRPPHYSSKSFETLTLVRDQEPVPPRQLQPRVSRDLETIVLKCLRKEPAKRYSNARALAEDLERVLSGLPILARPINRVEQVSMWVKRHRMACSLTILTAVWLATCGLLAWRYHAMLHLYHTVLSRVSPLESNDQLGNLRMTIPQAADGSIHLTGSTAAISGDTLAIEAHYGNLGYWHSDNDRAVWAFRVDRPATFAVSLDYACLDASAGNRYELRVGDDVIRGTTVGTGSWSNYQSFVVGELKIPAGVHRLEVRLTEQVRTALFDLRDHVEGSVGPDRERLGDSGVSRRFWAVQRDDRQRRAIRPATAPGGEHGLGILPDLLGGLEDLLEGPFIIVLAVGRRVVATDLGPVEIDPATVVGRQVVASRHHEEIPLALLDVDHRLAMGQVPADGVVVIPGGRVVDRQGEIAAALPGAVVAQAFAGLELIAAGFGLPGLAFRFHG